jgi:hypothetical protein
MVVKARAGDLIRTINPVMMRHTLVNHRIHSTSKWSEKGGNLILSSIKKHLNRVNATTHVSTHLGLDVEGI